MKAIMALLAVMLPLVTTNAGAAGMKRQMAADGVGVSTLAVPVPERGGTMDVTLWYPAAASGQPVLIGESAFFRGVQALRDAPAATNSLPLVLLWGLAVRVGLPEHRDHEPSFGQSRCHPRANVRTRSQSTLG